jgi:FkbM family methyltransferase
VDTYYSTIERLIRRGARFATVIDVGCADGQFFLEFFVKGLFREATALNIDANALYEPSLKAIQEAAGGHYRICAVADRPGEIEMLEAQHPYWSSIRPAGDLYWTRSNSAPRVAAKVPVATLDSLAAELDLKPPFLLKMDVQGAETQVLLGARKVLTETLAVISEVDVADFQDINAGMVETGFDLYDVVNLHRVPDGDLGWLYACYISKDLDHLKPTSFWNESDNAAVLDRQIKRRVAVLEHNSMLINRLRFGGLKLDRNAPCPCNGGRKFKHCCGAFA